MRFLFSILIKNHVFIVFLFLFIFCLSLIFKLNPYHENISFNLITNFFHNTHSAKKNYLNYFSLNKENKKLIQELLNLKNEKLDLIENNELLKSIIKNEKANFIFSDDLDKRYKYIHARVEKNNWALQKNIILLNKGKVDGIEKLDEVSNENGAIGEVTKVTNHFCEVTTLLHLETDIFATIKKNGKQTGKGQLTWDGKSNKYAQLEIGIDQRVNIGDSVFNKTEVYIGKIDKINPKTSSKGQKIEVLLGVNFQNIQEVFILKDKLQDELIEFRQ
tara:strand:+ start:15 stop:839 length:825 start_codon:yes stop_codon:yes gene_type:complete